MCDLTKDLPCYLFIMHFTPHTLPQYSPYVKFRSQVWHCKVGESRGMEIIGLCVPCFCCWEAINCKFVPNLLPSIVDSSVSCILSLGAKESREFFSYSLAWRNGVIWGFPGWNKYDNIIFWFEILFGTGLWVLFLTVLYNPNLFSGHSVQYKVFLCILQQSNSHLTLKFGFHKYSLFFFFIHHQIKRSKQSLFLLFGGFDQLNYLPQVYFGITKTRSKKFTIS